MHSNSHSREKQGSSLPESERFRTPAQRPPSLFRVGLLLQTGQAYMREVSRGVFRFLRANRHWRIVGTGYYPLLQWEELDQWRGDGLIAIPNSQAQMDALLKAGVPVVNAGSRFLDPQMVTVASDNEMIGRVAAQHLLDCRLQHFLVVGELAWDNEQIRHRSFADSVAAAGYRCDLLTLPVHERLTPDASARYHPDLDLLAEGLRKIPKPAGVFAPNSVLARFVAEVARNCGYEVPDQIAVLGANDDPLVCESTSPHLTAVVQPSERIGLEAAKRLDEMMRGQQSDPSSIFLPPLGVAARQSTDTLAIDDDDVRAAIRIIRDRARDAIDIAHVADEVGISRRNLEIRFHRAVGRTPATELRRTRIAIAKKLLIETTDSLTNIVFASGFNSRQVFSTLFRKETGMTPSAFRKQHQSETLGYVARRN